ncbi:hypothetical protein [Nocardioides sp. P86]|uniref:hypothetical protein n=1 Tax=Nocardioides sp. P86 TaxID=2939569 RepID=UPI00204052AC|nr:hypothetical protein [Nocardioides sp. P86]MCM3513648.1 hypothetical protein [Nocardioides sp. P86]
MDDAAWAALTLTLTALGAVGTWLVWRRRGPAPALRIGGLTLLPLAAYLTDTLQMATRIGTAVSDWAAGLVLSPVVWTGIVLAGVGVGLVLLAGSLTARGIGVRGVQREGALGPARGAAPAGADGSAAPTRATRTSRAERKAATASGAGKGEPAIDDDLADIEALLRKRGIS